MRVVALDVGGTLTMVLENGVSDTLVLNQLDENIAFGIPNITALTYFIQKLSECGVFFSLHSGDNYLTTQELLSKLNTKKIRIPFALMPVYDPKKFPNHDYNNPKILYVHGKTFKEHESLPDGESITDYKVVAGFGKGHRPDGKADLRVALIHAANRYAFHCKNVPADVNKAESYVFDDADPVINVASREGWNGVAINQQKTLVGGLFQVYQSIKPSLSHEERMLKKEQDIVSHDLTRIFERVYLGTRAAAIPDYLALTNRPDAMITIISLSGNFNPLVDSISFDQATLSALPPEKYLRIKIADSRGGNETTSAEKWSIALFDRAYQVMSAAYDKGSKIVVHCDAGANRSPAVMLYFLMKKFNLPFSMAKNIIINERPATENSELIAYLEEQLIPHANSAETLTDANLSILDAEISLAKTAPSIWACMDAEQLEKTLPESQDFMKLIFRNENPECTVSDYWNSLAANQKQSFLVEAAYGKLRTKTAQWEIKDKELRRHILYKTALTLADITFYSFIPNDGRDKFIENGSRGMLASERWNKLSLDEKKNAIKECPLVLHPCIAKFFEEQPVVSVPPSKNTSIWAGMTYNTLGDLLPNSGPTLKFFTNKTEDERKRLIDASQFWDGLSEKDRQKWLALAVMEDLLPEEISKKTTLLSFDELTVSALQSGPEKDALLRDPMLQNAYWNLLTNNDKRALFIKHRVVIQPRYRGFFAEELITDDNKRVTFFSGAKTSRQDAASAAENLPYAR